MTFAKWKNGSAFKLFLLGDFEANRASEAAYKAGLRAGTGKAKLPVDAAAICASIAKRHERSKYYHISELYRAEGARECEEAMK